MLCKKDTLSNDLIDFASNDYLGFLSQKFFKDRQYLIKNSIVVPSFYLGTGPLETEDLLLIKTETALIFNSV
jgi:hypothetical protein